MRDEVYYLDLSKATPGADVPEGFIREIRPVTDEELEDMKKQLVAFLEAEKPAVTFDETYPLEVDETTVLKTSTINEVREIYGLPLLEERNP